MRAPHWFGVALMNLMGGVYLTTLGSRVAVGSFVVMACATGMAIMEIRHGHRQAGRDRNDSDSSTATGEVTRHFAVNPLGPIAKGADPGLIERTADVPILARKTMIVGWQPGQGLRLCAQNGAEVQRDAEAVCSRGKDHIAPDPNCTCGFYAMAPDQPYGYMVMGPGDGGIVTVDVELSGRVIVHEKGYRAQHQRILNLNRPRCFYCGETATVVEFYDAPVTVSSSPYLGLQSLTRTAAPLLTCVCDAHTQLGRITLALDKLFTDAGFGE